jgi:ABC-type transport system involved in multi-copper enzyme maturation permease subunit
MRAILITEIRRMTSRRSFRAVAVLAILGILAAAVIVAIRSGPAGGIAGDERYHLTSLTVALKAISPVLVIAAWLVGASFVGADWHAGTIATLLTWEPRRLRVMVAKLAGCLAVVFASVIVFQMLLVGGLALVASLRGTTAGVDPAWTRDTIGVALRVAALAVVGAAVGFAIASVARNTAAALGVGFGYLFVVENLVRGLRPHWVGWLLGDNAVVFITGQSAGLPLHRTMLQAGLLLSVYTAALVLLSVALFRGRDVS